MENGLIDILFVFFFIQLAFPSEHLRTLIDLQVDGSVGTCVHLVIFIKMSWAKYNGLP